MKKILIDKDGIKEVDLTAEEIAQRETDEAEAIAQAEIETKKKADAKKCKKKIDYFNNCLEPEKILPKKKWFKNFEKIWIPDEKSALKELQNFDKSGEEKTDSSAHSFL